MRLRSAQARIACIDEPLTTGPVGRGSDQCSWQWAGLGGSLALKSQGTFCTGSR